MGVGEGVGKGEGDGGVGDGENRYGAHGCGVRGVVWMGESEGMSPVIYPSHTLSLSLPYVLYTVNYT